MRAPPAIKESAKLLINGIQRTYVVAGKALGFIDFPVPRFSSMMKTSSKTVRHYYVSGITCALPIATIAMHYGVPLREKINVLDFGCGVGRQLLHMTRHFPCPQYSACDVDATLVEFIRRSYPGVSAHVTRFDPPLPFESDALDMIYSVSTFSHINPEHQRSWLKELARITKPEAYCFLTTEGWTALKMMSDVFDIRVAADDLKKNGILYKEYDYYAAEKARKHLSSSVNLLKGIDRSYGSTVMTPDFIRQNWTVAGFQVVDVIEGIIDWRQDLVVLRKDY
jgi:SAM-dependent methyltransferase